MIKIMLRFALCTLLIAMPPALIYHLGKVAWLAPHFWEMFGFFAIVTWITCFMVLMGQRFNSKLGAQLFLAATIIKLLGCMSFAIAYLLKFAVNGTIFLPSFFYLYFCFTVFEIYTLLSNLRVQNKK
jgi:hypothetical protein